MLDAMWGIVQRDKPAADDEQSSAGASGRKLRTIDRVNYLLSFMEPPASPGPVGTPGATHLCMHRLSDIRDRTDHDSHRDRTKEYSGPHTRSCDTVCYATLT